MDNYNNGQNQYNQFGNQSHQGYGAGVDPSLLEGNPTGKYTSSYDDSYQTTYQSSYNDQLGANQPKKKKINIKTVVIIGIIVFVLGSMVSIGITIYKAFNENYKITDFDKFNNICEEIFGVELELTELNGHYGTPELNYGVVMLGQDIGTIDGVSYNIQWIEMDSKGSTSNYLKKLDMDYDNQHEDENGKYSTSGKTSTPNKIDWYYTYKDKSGYKCRKFAVKNDKYMVVLELSGKKDDVDNLYKKFKKKIQ